MALLGLVEAFPLHSVPVPEGVPLAPPAIAPRAKPPTKAFVPEFDDSDYEDSAWEEELTGAAGNMGDKEDTEPTRPRSLRLNSLFSEDELVEDYFDAPPAG
ncbi:hypothetical protein AV530_013985 [Patagioenas fasciata monilis]|uniref:Uncharacterized protein n=1 Tax=Patagioenas fasciata monilis TaxID=372326 RepID=A0A1V4J575_PATFA|nr:hypothetical protein AV530_013985 [Patagioenas fasciata monilis]